jgi:hypothetical protein
MIDRMIFVQIFPRGIPAAWRGPEGGQAHGEVCQQILRFKPQPGTAKCSTLLVYCRADTALQTPARYSPVKYLICVLLCRYCASNPNQVPYSPVKYLTCVLPSRYCASNPNQVPYSPVKYLICVLPSRCCASNPNQVPGTAQ